MAVDLILMGKIFKERREELGLNQATIAEKSNSSQAYVSGLESGTIKNPTTNKLIAVCEALKMSYDELMSLVCTDYSPKSSDKFTPSKAALELAKTFMGLTPQSQKIVKIVAENAAKVEKLEKTSKN